MSGQSKSMAPEDVAADPSWPVFHFDFDPVIARSRALSANPERVQLICEPCVRRLAPADIFIAEERGFFLIVQSCAGTAAEALAHEINVALLELFFGTEVLTGLGTICRRASFSEVEAKLGRSMPRPPPPRPATDAVEADPLARLATSGMDKFDGLKTGFLPMINMRNGQASIFWCGAIRNTGKNTLFGSAALAGLDSRDRAPMDEAILEYSLGYARRMQPVEGAVAIGTSVSFETLAWSRGRQLYQKALRAANQAHNPFFLVKIEDIPPGTPAARLAELTAVVRPFVRRVFLELPEMKPGAFRNGYLGASGLVAALPQQADPHALSRLMGDLSQVAGLQQALACVTGAENAALALARKTGIRFAAPLHAVPTPFPGAERATSLAA